LNSNIHNKNRNDFKAVRYNGYLLDENKTNDGLKAFKDDIQLNNGAYAFFVDYLILNLKGIPNLDENKLFFEVAEYGTKTFENKVTINHKYEKFCTIVFNPRSKILAQDLVQLQIENHLFYTHPLSELKERLNDILKILGLKFHSVNRLDLALDMSNQNDFIYNVIQSLNSNQLRISGRKKKMTFHAETNKGLVEFEGVTVGKRTTGRMLRLYNKTKENERTLKTYIYDAWGKLKINRDDVWRFEYQMHNSWLRTVNFQLNDLFDNDFLFNLFLEANNKHFTIKHNTGKSEVNKEQDFHLFDRDYLAKQIKVLKVAIQRIKRNIKQSFIGQQRIIKGLVRSYFSSGQNTVYLEPINSILDDFHLWSWFMEKKQWYIKEFYEKGIFKTLDLDKLQIDLGIEL
jgi:hypothetical protein